MSVDDRRSLLLEILDGEKKMLKKIFLIVSPLMDLSRKKLFVISRNTVRYTTRRTWDVKRERRLEEEGGEKTTSERGEKQHVQQQPMALRNY